MTTVSKPIEKLIEDLEQERAKEYWERIKRLKDQAEEQKKSREALAQRDLEYLRSTGIDLKKVESDQEEDARNLKSYLEQKRPPLISRPKQTRRVYIPPIGPGLIPTKAIYIYPPDPGYVPPSSPSPIRIKAVSTGTGGWGWPWAVAQVPVPPVDVVFNFTPHQDASYTFTAWFTFDGFYFLKADDSWYTSKSAEVKVTVSLSSFQFVDRPEKSFPVISSGSQNINEFDNFDHVLSFSDTQDFRAGESVVVTARIEVDAFANGDGSYAEVNFEDGDANYIMPLGLVVNPVP